MNTAKRSKLNNRGKSEPGNIETIENKYKNASKTNENKLNSQN